jgi:hypothetical protein
MKETTISRSPTVNFRAAERIARSKPITIIVLLCFLILGLTSCSGSLSASSSCKDFLNASQSAQVQAIDKIAAAENAPDATTPLGMPNVSYLCAGNPSQTLGWAVGQSR